MIGFCIISTHAKSKHIYNTMTDTTSSSFLGWCRDPDFKGYLNVICEENCTVSYHPCCWKAVKEQRDGSVNRLSDKVGGGECVCGGCRRVWFECVVFWMYTTSPNKGKKRQNVIFPD